MIAEDAKGFLGTMSKGVCCYYASLQWYVPAE